MLLWDSFRRAPGADLPRRVQNRIQHGGPPGPAVPAFDSFTLSYAIRIPFFASKGKSGEEISASAALFLKNRMVFVGNVHQPASEGRFRAQRTPCGRYAGGRKKVPPGREPGGCLLAGRNRPPVGLTGQNRSPKPVRRLLIPEGITSSYRSAGRSRASRSSNRETTQSVSERSVNIVFRLLSLRSAGLASHRPICLYYTRACRKMQVALCTILQIFLLYFPQFQQTVQFWQLFVFVPRTDLGFLLLLSVQKFAPGLIHRVSGEQKFAVLRVDLHVAAYITELMCHKKNRLSYRLSGKCIPALPEMLLFYRRYSTKKRISI